jgi:AAA+ ATPase superfamily predicted ATPase
VSRTVTRGFPFSLSLTAFAVGGLASAVIGFAWTTRAGDAMSAELTAALHDRIYLPIARAEGHARLLASHEELRAGLAERNRLRLARVIRQSLQEMGLTHAGVLLPDGTPYFWLPNPERSAPIIASRIPIEHELRTIGTLEYGVTVDDGLLRELSTALSTDVRLAISPPSLSAPSDEPAALSNPPANGEVVVRMARDRAATVYLRAPGDRAGPIVVTLQCRAPGRTAAAARLARQRNLLWGVVAGLVMLVTGYDVRQRRRRAVQPPAFTTITNPYIVGNPIRTSDMFFGRDDDFQFARQKLTSERAGLVLVFCGERRSGKTSMLFQILDGRLGREFLPVLIDMQYFAAISRDQDFYASVVREIVRAVYPEAEQHERRQRFNLPSDSAAQSFELILDDAMTAHPDKTFLFLFDEYEILESKIDRGELSHMVIPYLAGLLERKRRISFIFTGSRTLEERPTQHWRVMIGKAQYRKISYLSPADTERLIVRPVAGRVQYAGAAVASILRLTSGQPFYTQVICQNLVDYLNEARRVTIEPSDVSAIVDTIVDNPLPQMIYFWDSLPFDQKIALSLLSESLGDEAAWANASRLLTMATDNGVPVGMSVAALEVALERLFEQELLEKSGERMFRYRIDLLRHWIRRMHSIWQVIKETSAVPHAGV